MGSKEEVKVHFTTAILKFLKLLVIRSDFLQRINKTKTRQKYFTKFVMKIKYFCVFDSLIGIAINSF